MHQIASITFVGQFPHGIKPHVDNLSYYLSKNDHIYLITLPEYESFIPIKKNLTFIPFYTIQKGFINFWSDFSKILYENEIEAKYFLFMEQDILFFSRPYLPENKKTILSFLPQGDYKNILLNNNLLHSRVWEGAQIIHSDIVKNAINKNINFSFTKETFFSKNKNFYEKMFDGILTVTKDGNPDTFDEFSLFCALEEKTNIIHDTKSVHLRGPETIYRNFQNFKKPIAMEEIEELQKKIKYIDLYLVAAIFYSFGLWNCCDHINWKLLKNNSVKDLKKISDGIWLDNSIKQRIQIILQQL